MILTIDKKDKVVLTDFQAKSGLLQQIGYLHHLYSTPNFELGYLQHGPVWFHQEKPIKNVLITSKNIQVYDEHTWGVTKKSESYPINYFTTKAKNTLMIIRALLELENSKYFILKDFFEESSREVTLQGFVKPEKMDFQLQIEKLQYILQNPALALSLLKDAYLDFYLFVDLLTKVDIVNSPQDFSFPSPFYEVAGENTKILTLATAFAKLK